MGSGGGEGYAISEHPTCAEDASALRAPNVPPRCSPLANGGGDGSGVIGGSSAQRSAPCPAGVPVKCRPAAVVATAAGERDADSAQREWGSIRPLCAVVCRHMSPYYAVRSLVRAVLLMSYHNSAWRAAPAPPAYPPPRRADPAIGLECWTTTAQVGELVASRTRTAHCGVGARADCTPRALPAHRRAAARGRARGTHVTCDSVVDEILRRR